MTNVQRAVLAVRIHAELQKRGETIADQAERIQRITCGDQKIMKILVDLQSQN
jgi:hypothetical protein